MAQTVTVTWRLRWTAASRGIWKATQFRDILEARGLHISAGKLSRLWSGESPVSVKLEDLALFCSVLDCGVEDLLVVEGGRSRRWPEMNERGRPVDSLGRAASRQ